MISLLVTLPAPLEKIEIAHASQEAPAEAEKIEPTKTQVKTEKPKEQAQEQPRDPNGCEPEQYWAKEPPYQCIDKPVKKSSSPQKTTTEYTPRTIGGTCADWVRQAGITEVDAALKLIARESNCRPTVEGSMTNLGRAYGIPQSLPGNKMASHGADWRTNPVTQLRWMRDYVNDRYGSFSAALAHSYANNWY